MFTFFTLFCHFIVFISYKSEFCIKYVVLYVMCIWTDIWILIRGCKINQIVLLKGR